MTQKLKRLEENVPKTLDNMREFNPTMITADPADSNAPEDPESSRDIAEDPFAAYFQPSENPMAPQKVLITTSPRSTKTTYEFCEELVSIFPGAELIRRKKGKGFEIGRIAAWAANRGYNNMIVVNEDRKTPNAITFIHLPEGPSAYFKLTSVIPSHKIHNHAKQTPHNPELVLNNFVTRLGHTVGRMWQTLFPQMPEFQGRQVVTLHNQRDFLFFRRHRYAFRSTEKVALQEIGPRFTLKLRWLKRGIPAVRNLEEQPPQPQIKGDNDSDDETAERQAEMECGDKEDGSSEARRSITLPANELLIEPPKEDVYDWQWKPQLEITKRTFFL